MVHIISKGFFTFILLFKIISSQRCTYQRPITEITIETTSPVTYTHTDEVCKNLASNIENVVVSNLRKNAAKTSVFGPISKPLIDEIVNQLNCQCPLCSKLQPNSIANLITATSSGPSLVPSSSVASLLNTAVSLVNTATQYANSLASSANAGTLPCGCPNLVTSASLPCGCPSTGSCGCLLNSATLPCGCPNTFSNVVSQPICRCSNVLNTAASTYGGALSSAIMNCGCPNSACSCPNLACGCPNSACSCKNSACSCPISACSCPNLACGCPNSACSCPISACSCPISTCSCQNSACTCPNSACSCQNSACTCPNSACSCPISTCSCPNSACGCSNCVGNMMTSASLPCSCPNCVGNVVTPVNFPCSCPVANVLTPTASPYGVTEVLSCGCPKGGPCSCTVSSVSSNGVVDLLNLNPGSVNLVPSSLTMPSQSFPRRNSCPNCKCSEFLSILGVPTTVCRCNNDGFM